MSCSHHELVDTWERLGSHAEITPTLRDHVDDCAVCAARVEDILSIRALVADLPAPPLSEERAEHMRALLVDRVQTVSSHRDDSANETDTPRREKPNVSAEEHGGETSTTQRWSRTRIAVAAVLLIGAGFVLRGWTDHVFSDSPTTSSEGSTAEVTSGFWIAEEGAQLDQLSAGPREIVWLRHGAAWFKVNPLPKGSVFRVIAGESEVEVVGTRFRVDVEHGRLRSVHVAEGRVIVRTQGQPVAHLTAGDRWTSAAFQTSSHPQKTPDGSRIADRDRPSQSEDTLSAAKVIEPTSQNPKDLRDHVDASSLSSENTATTQRTRPHKPKALSTALLLKKRRRSDQTASSQNSLRPKQLKKVTRSTRHTIEKNAAHSDDPSHAKDNEHPKPSKEQRSQPQPSVDERFAEAWSLYQSGRFEAASRKLTDVSKIPQQDHARHAEILYWTARANIKAGLKQEAKNHLKRSLKLSPDGWWADDARRLLRTLGDPGEQTP